MAGDEAEGRRLARENEQLRLRVAELERELKRGGDAGSSELGVRLALLQEAERITHVGTWLWNLQTDEVQWSDELFRILGYDPNVDEPSTEAFFARVHPEDRERVRAGAARGVASGVAEQVDYRVLWPDGTIREVSMGGAFVFDDAGALARSVGTVADLTDELAAAAELRRERQLLADVARAVRVGWFRYDVAQGHVRVSESLRELLGLPAGAFEPGAFAHRMLAADRDRADAALARLHEGDDPSPLQLSVLGPDDRLVHVYVAPSLERERGVLRVVRGVVFDVSERAELEARLRQIEKTEVLGQVAAGVAHDFNNLLTVIQCSVATLPESPAAEHIESAAASAALLTRQLLAFTRQAVIEPRLIDVRDGIDACVAIVQRTFPENIHVQYATPPDPLVTRMDPGQLQQILLNLAVNARDAMEDGGGELRIDARALDDDTIELEVSDGGVGMDERLVALVFEPFFTTKEPGKGTGLGLSTVANAVRQAGGAIDVRSRPGQGSTFRVRLPRADEAPEERTAAADSDAPPRRILVIEDERLVARALAHTLRDLGHDVSVYATPDEGLAAARAGEGFELAITDYLMPTMTGVELMERLRQLDPELPVLIMSGWGFDAGEVTGMARTHALAKPFSREELMDGIERATAE